MWNVEKFEELVKRIDSMEYEDIDDIFDDLGEVSKIIKPVLKYVKIHGDICFDCGSEWLYQSDIGQQDALRLVGEILDNFVEE